MSLPDKMQEYIAELCKQIRFGRVHLFVAEEMKAHLIDGRDAYIAQGFDVETATEQSIHDAGDAVLLGAQFDRVHRPKPQWAMFLWVAGFLMLGLLMNIVLFGNMPTIGQLAGIAVGIFLMLAMYFLDFTVFGKYPRLIYGGLLLLWVAISRLMLLSLDLHGSILMLFIFRIISVLLPLALVGIFFRAKGKGYKGLFTCFFAYGLVCILVFVSADAFVHFAFIGAALLVIANVRNWFGIHRGAGTGLSLLCFISGLGVSIFALMSNIHYSRMRFLTAFDPQIDPQGFGFMATQVREMLDAAIFFGRGAEIENMLLIWRSELQYNFLLTALIYRFGWISFVLVLALLLFFIIKAAKGCFRQKSDLGFFVSIAVVLTFAAQVLSYVAYNLGFLLTQLSLPFFTLGNAAMIANLGLIGVMLSVFRTGDMPNELERRPSSAMKN